jgi:hypothetical protein
MYREKAYNFGSCVAWSTNNFRGWWQPLRVFFLEIIGGAVSAERMEDTMTKVRKLARGCCAALLILGVAGCAPKITRFDVLPVHVCEGTASAVTWEISGSLELMTTPAIQPLQGEPLRYQATEDTVFTLRVTRWPYQNPQVSETEVIVYRTPPLVSEPIAFQMQCDGSSLIGILPRPATQWDPRIRLETVASDGSREITVEHEGRSSTLTASAPSSTAFQGAPMAGTWQLTTPLSANERCGDPGAAPPARIILTTHLMCAR